MFELDHDLAQDIVDRAMAILPYNVNVMDSQGLILGSGEPERINTRHEGAQLVLANGRVVEIDAQTAKCLKGVQPGINLPLLLDQRLIGVLGLTGEPEQLRTYAELVRMTAEMLVGQRHQQAEQQWRRQRCDDLVALLLSESGDSPRLIDEAQQLGLKPQLSRIPYLFELGKGQSAEALSVWLQSRYPDSWCARPTPRCCGAVRPPPRWTTCVCWSASMATAGMCYASPPAGKRMRSKGCAGVIAAWGIYWPMAVMCCRTPVY